jgi:hypothetical protein
MYVSQYITPTLHEVASVPNQGVGGRWSVGRGFCQAAYTVWWATHGGQNHNYS